LSLATFNFLLAIFHLSLRLICAILNAKLNSLQTRAAAAMVLTEDLDSDLDIRIAHESDLAALCRLWQERQVILNQMDPRIPMPTPELRDQVERRFHDRITQTGTLFVGGPGSEVSGYITGLLHNAAAVVDDMALDAHRYLPGLGRALWIALRDHFLSSGATRFAIAVPRYDTVAQAFWRSLGAKNLLETPEYAQWTIPTYCQWLTL
jgi:hypothetical protein